MNLRLPIVLLPLLLAGCTGAVVPEDAAVDTHDRVPEGTLHGWLEQGANATQFVGRFEYDGVDLLRVNWVQPHGYWNLTILDASGEQILYDERPSRKDFDENLQGPFHEEFYFTWTHIEYERYQRAGTYDDIPFHPVAPGNYTAQLSFMVFGQPEDAFRVELPFTVE